MNENRKTAGHAKAVDGKTDGVRSVDAKTGLGRTGSSRTGGSKVGRESKPHIGIFGRCNTGKSTLLNFLVGSDTAITSPQPGTTTDVVRKSFEIVGLAPVIFIDTAGIDDTSPLGPRRVRRTLATIDQIDLAIVLFREWGLAEEELLGRLHRAELPYILIRNLFVGEEGNMSLPKAEAGSGEGARGLSANHPAKAAITIDLSSAGEGEREEIIARIGGALPETSYSPPMMFEGRELAGKRILLVCPIDSEAPAGRLILPQVQALRELLDRHAIALVAQPEEVAGLLGHGSHPALDPVLVVTDSQVYPQVRALVPEHLEVTTFSILLAASKGDYALYLKGLERVDTLNEGDRVLISESCSHQVSCEDIGRVKIPAWLENYSGHRLEFTFVSGLEPLPDDIADYALMVQCGGCMSTRTQLRGRIRAAAAEGVAVTNYGMLIRKICK